MPLPRILIVDDYPDALDVWGFVLARGWIRGLHGVRRQQRVRRGGATKTRRDRDGSRTPGKSGYEVARDLKARVDTRSIPLIAATGYSHAKQLDLARASGFDSVIVKPCDPESLVAEIRRMLPEPEAAASEATRRETA